MDTYAKGDHDAVCVCVCVGGGDWLLWLLYHKMANPTIRSLMVELLKYSGNAYKNICFTLPCNVIVCSVL